MTTQFNAIAEVIAVYFDGLYYSDTTRLRQAFHPRAHYVCATDGEWLFREMEEYFTVVDNRPSPASRSERRTDRIRSIEFAGPETARACVNCSIGDRFFTDFLTLVLHEDRWQIISKVFHHEQLRS